MFERRKGTMERTALLHYGYKLETQDFGTYKKKVLVEDELTSEIVRKIFKMRASDTPVKDIVCWLNDNKIRNSRNKPFNKNSLQHLFQNKKYIGINTYGEKEFPRYYSSYN